MQLNEFLARVYFGLIFGGVLGGSIFLVAFGGVAHDAIKDEYSYRENIFRLASGEPVSNFGENNTVSAYVRDFTIAKIVLGKQHFERNLRVHQFHLSVAVHASSTIDHDTLYELLREIYPEDTDSTLLAGSYFWRQFAKNETDFRNFIDVLHGKKTLSEISNVFVHFNPTWHIWAFFLVMQGLPATLWIKRSDWYEIPWSKPIVIFSACLLLPTVLFALLIRMVIAFLFMDIGEWADKIMKKRDKKNILTESDSFNVRKGSRDVDVDLLKELQNRVKKDAVL